MALHNFDQVKTQVSDSYKIDETAVLAFHFGSSSVGKGGSFCSCGTACR